VEDFAEWHMRSKTDYEMADSEGSYCDEDKEFLQLHNANSLAPNWSVCYSTRRSIYALLWDWL
jgi:hypothetical protein